MWKFIVKSFNKTRLMFILPCFIDFVYFNPFSPSHNSYMQHISVVDSYDLIIHLSIIIIISVFIIP